MKNRNYSIVKELRKELSIQQKELAERLDITRQTLTKYESEPEAIPIPVIKKMAVILGVDYATIIDNKRYDKEEAVKKNNIIRNEIREEIPLDVTDKFACVFMYIISKCGAEPKVGKSSLGKMLYLMDYNWYKKTGKDLMYVKFVKTPTGPEPLSFDNIIDSLEKKNLVETFISKTYNKGMTKYIPCIEPKLNCLTANELYFINSEMTKYHLMNEEEFDIILEHNDAYVKTPISDVYEMISFE